MKSLKRNVCILFSALLATCCGAIGAGALKAQTAEAETTPTLTIESNNLSYSEYIYMLYAVSSDGFDRAENPIQLLFWEGEQTEYVYGTQDDSVATSGQATVKEKDCLVYYSRGLAAKEMTVDLYTRAYAEVDGVGYYSEIHKVSVVDYVYTMRENKALDEVTDSLFTEMLEYGAAAQLKFNFNTDKLANTPYYRVTVENGAFLDGNTTARFQEGESVTLVANPAPEGETFSHWKDELGSVVSTEATWEIEEITATKTYTAVYKSNGAGDIVGEKTVCATFTFGENGNATHEDGNEVSDGKAYTDGDYTLTLSGVSKVFGEARDAMGNSALKLGTSSVVGSFTFIVPEDVVSVDLHIAKYKVRESKITVNGGEAVVLTKNSDDGEYDVITVDTSEIKTVTVSTATGATRVMVNTVVWYRLEETVSASEGLAYTLNEDGESYSVTGIGECTDTDIIIPATYEGKPVTRIGTSAFESSSLIGVEIPDSVTSIGNYAFIFCGNLTSVIIPDSVMSIGEMAFEGCTNLASVEIGNGVTSIGGYAFNDCSSLTSITVSEKNDTYCSIDGNLYLYTQEGISLFYYARGKTATEFTIPDGITSIGVDAFYKCRRLTSVIIPDSVTSIGSEAFYNCEGLTSVVIGNSVTSIGNSAFYGCSSLTKVYYKGTESEWAEISIALGNTYLTRAMKYYYSETEPTQAGHYWHYVDGEVAVWEYVEPTYSQGLVYTLNDDGESYSVTGIGTCTDTDIIIPATYEGKPVTSIGDNAFSQCSGLTSVVIPDSVTSIGDNAFSYCSSLTSVEIGDGVTSIGDVAFYNCTSLTSVVIGEGVTSIGEWAFESCTNLTSIEIPDSVTSIGQYAFFNCSSLTSVTIPDSVTSIGGGAFESCTSLTSIEIGDGVTSIGWYAFYNCNNLTSVYYKGTESEWANITIESDNEPLTNATRYYYSESEPTEAGNYWHYVDGEVTVWEYVEPTYSQGLVYTLNDDGESYSVAGIGTCTDTDIIIPATYEGKPVTALAYGAFYNNANITSVIIPNSVTIINRYVFYNCASLKSVLIPSSVTDVGDNAFAESNNVTIYCEEGCNPEDWESAWNKTNCPVYYYSESEPTEAGNYWHYVDGEIVVWEQAETPTYSQGLAYTLNEDGESYSVTGIGTCTDTDIIIPATYEGKPVTAIGAEAFMENESITSVEIPNSVTSIGEYAFHSCIALQSMEIPDSVTSFGEAVFVACANLKTVTLPATLDSIAMGMFYYCTALESITIPETVTSIGEMAFAECTSLTSIHIPDSVATIGESPFILCSSLTEITVGANNANYKAIDGNLYTMDGTVLIQYALAKTATEFIIPDGVVTIPLCAMDGASNLTRAVIPDSVTTIVDEAFDSCTSLETVVIGSGVTEIGDSAFLNCTSLTAVYYNGTESDWANITIGTDNSYLTNATRYYYSESEPTINAEGTAYDNNYWYYVDGEITVWDFANHVHNYVDGVCDGCGAEDPDYEEPTESVKAVYATFTFGENGEAAHKDGNALTAPKTYTDTNGAELTFTSLTKAYAPAYDAMGNSCLKFGTSSVVGSFTFTVPENVVSVELHIAKYKANTSKVSINGGDAVALTKNSNDGEYDVITVDTSSTKTVTVSTASGGVRMMLNTIVWYHMEEVPAYSQGLAYTLNEDGESYSVTGIGECTDTDIIIIPSAYEGKPVTAIGAGAFQGCTSFSSITIPTSVQKIGGYAFYESSVTSVVLEEADSWNKLTYTYTAPNEYGAEETTTYTYDLSNAEKAAAALKGGVKLCTSGEYRGEEDETGLPILTYYYTTFTWYNTTWTRTQEV